MKFTFLRLLVPLLFLSSAVADTRPILLVTPKGVYQAEVVDGVPGPWKATDVDVIVQGFSNTGGPNTTPPNQPPGEVPLPPVDLTVAAVSNLSKTILQNKDEATALAALIDALIRSNLSGVAFNEALEMAVPIVDSSLKSEGRLSKWREEVIKISTDPKKLKEGLQAAFGISGATLTQVAEASAAPAGAAIPESAIELTKIIQLIQMILDLLKNLGII